MSLSRSKCKKIGETRVNLSSSSKSNNQSNSNLRSPATISVHNSVMNTFNLFADETNNSLLQNISEKEILDKVNGTETMFQDYYQWLIVQSIVPIDDEANIVSKTKHKLSTQRQYLSETIKFLKKKFKSIEMIKETKRN